MTAPRIEIKNSKLRMKNGPPRAEKFRFMSATISVQQESNLSGQGPVQITLASFSP